MTRDHGTAIRTLVERPHCTDAVIERLEMLDAARPRNGALLADLSAAYYLRAQRRDRPADLLHALGKADAALEAAPGLLAAQFNRALAQEALALRDQAVDSWNAIRQAQRNDWGDEASAHHQRLVSATAVARATQWPVNEQRLKEGTVLRDANALAQLIDPYPLAAQRFVEEEVLPAWATAVEENRLADAQRQLELASIVARQVVQSAGDRYLSDMVDRVRNGGGAVQAMLREAHLALREGRLEERIRPKTAEVQYLRAQRLFAAAGSPAAAARAQLGVSVTRWVGTRNAQAAGEALAPVDEVARRHDYGSLLARVGINRGNLLTFGNRYVDALVHFDRAIATARRKKDPENAANAHIRKSAALRVLGHKERAAADALQAIHLLQLVADVPARHVVLGEAAMVAFEHGYPAIAILYQNEAVQLLQEALSRTSDEREITFLRNNLASALRGRAAIQLNLNRPELAAEDLNDAMRLLDSTGSDTAEIVRNAILARIREAAGQKALKTGQPRLAAEAFTNALDLLFLGDYRTYRATIFMQRAEAYGALGEATNAERDLRAAIDELRAEERHILEYRHRGEAEPYWTPYFSRFREVYERLIRHLVGQKREREAFRFAEQARAFEPLNLVLQLDSVSDTFRLWTRDGKTLPLEAIQSSLDERTFVVEFSVLPEQTLIWIVGRNHFELFTRPVARERIARWSTSLQRHAQDRNNRAFMTTVEEVHDVLLGDVMARIRALRPADEPSRVVFVPDFGIHGLPLSALRDRDRKRYLIEDHTVSVAASATFYAFARQRDEVLARSAAAPSVLLVGDPAFNARLPLASDLHPLPWARLEVERLGALYGQAAVKLEREKATAAEFLRLAETSTIVHFAGHAVANADAPFRSLLLLTPAPGHSGVLIAEELLTRLKVDSTRLVVLSACSSAGGVTIGPEGLAPLVRPLIVAGVPAVVGSLWNVGDKSSAELLVAFHRHFRAGSDADQALRLAQLELLHRKPASAYGSVLAWAPFEVVGHASSPYR